VDFPGPPAIEMTPPFFLLVLLLMDSAPLNFQFFVYSGRGYGFFKKRSSPPPFPRLEKDSSLGKDALLTISPRLRSRLVTARAPSIPLQNRLLFGTKRDPTSTPLFPPRPYLRFRAITPPTRSLYMLHGNPSLPEFSPVRLILPPGPMYFAPNNIGPPPLQSTFGTGMVVRTAFLLSLFPLSGFPLRQSASRTNDPPMLKMDGPS